MPSEIVATPVLPSKEDMEHHKRDDPGSPSKHSLTSSSDVMDSELKELMRAYPLQVEAFLDNLFAVDPRRHKDPPDISHLKRRNILQPISSNGSVKPPPISHYREKYQPFAVVSSGNNKPTTSVPPEDALHIPRMRSSKRPKPSPIDPNPPKMSFTTWQRDSYQPVDVTHRVIPIKQGSTMAQATRQLVTGSGLPNLKCSVYRDDFKPQTIDWYRAGPPEQQNVRDSDSFYGQTTNKESFKTPPPEAFGAARRSQYGELPVFTASLLYPHSPAQQRGTVAQESYTPKKCLPTVLSKGVQPKLHFEGQHNFHTTNRDAYKSDGEPIKRRTPASFPEMGAEIIRQNKSLPFSNVTQFRHDYPGFTACKGGQPSPPKKVLPCQGTINLKLDNFPAPKGFQTEQRDVFRGHDVVRHPKLDMFDPKTKSSDTPWVPDFDIKTNQKDISITHSDYKLIDHSSLHRSVPMPPLKRDLIGIDEMGKFFAQTTNKAVYKRWTKEEAQGSRVRPVCFQGHSIEPVKHLRFPPAIQEDDCQDTLTTEMRRSYVLPKTCDVRQLCLPKPVAFLSQSCQPRFHTVTQKAYRGGIRTHLSKDQAKVLKKTLREYRKKNGSLTIQGQNHNSRGITV